MEARRTVALLAVVGACAPAATGRDRTVVVDRTTRPAARPGPPPTPRPIAPPPPGGPDGTDGLAPGPLADALRRLAAGDLATWTGLPAGLDARGQAAPGDGPAASWLGEGHEPADLLGVADPAPGTWARVWLRGPRVVLVEVRVEAGLRLDAARTLGPPDLRLDVEVGLRRLIGGEWVYAGRGLALVVDAAGRVAHLLAFAPCSVADYRRGLRVDLAVHRRPLSP